MNISIPNSVPTDLYRIITNDNDLAKYICSLVGRKNNYYSNKLLREKYFKRADKASVASLFTLQS